MENFILKSLESMSAHDDAVNSVVVGFDGLVFTESTDKYGHSVESEDQREELSYEAHTD